jgi:hypothetical protein
MRENRRGRCEEGRVGRKGERVSTVYNLHELFLLIYLRLCGVVTCWMSNHRTYIYVREA